MPRREPKAKNFIPAEILSTCFSAEARTGCPLRPAGLGVPPTGPQGGLWGQGSRAGAFPAPMGAT
jgi:hypothetical protein